MRTFLLILLLGLIATACTPPKPSSSANDVVRYGVEGEFESVRDDLKNAILAKGLVIDQTAYIAKMLQRTGKDVGATRDVFAPDHGQSFSFCSAVVSRKTVEADPHNLVFCPYSLVVYSTLAEPKKVYVAYRRPVLNEGNDAAKNSLKEVEALLDSIARDALRLPKPTP